MSHCTDALILSLRVLGIGFGDKVIVPSLTWVASASAILHVGAEPVFVDVEKDSYCLDLASIQLMRCKNVKAIIGVQLLGNLFKRNIEQYCMQEGIFLIEDAAEGLGASYMQSKDLEEARSGKIGIISCLSFHATKMINAFQGGAFLTDDDNLYISAKRIAHHGIDASLSNKYYWSNELGYNMAYSDLQSSLVFAQIGAITTHVENRRAIFEAYESALADSPIIELMPRLPSDRTQAFWLPTVLVKPEYRGLDLKEKVVRASLDYNLEIRPLFYPLHTMPTFQNYRYDDLSTTMLLSDEGFTLPTGNYMSPSVATDAAARLVIILENLLRLH